MADFSILKQQIAAALPENTEGEITATIMVAQFWAAIDAINTAKADQGDLEALAGVVAGKADIFGTSVPLSLEDNELTLKYDEYQFDMGGDDMTLTLRLSYGLVSNSIGVQVDAGDGLTFGDEGVLVASLGDGLAFDASGAIVPDFAFVQATIPDLAEIRQNAASPLHWLTGEAQEVEEGRIYTGTGILAAPGEFEVIKCYAVNYTNTAQTITCWRYPDTGSNAQTFTLAPFQVLALTCTIDEQQGSIWTAADSHYMRESDIFVATYGTTTAAEILAAYNAGKVVVCYYDNKQYVLATTSYNSDTQMIFSCVAVNYSNVIRVTKATSAWSVPEQRALEETSNKTSDIEGNKTSTTKYTSAKGVADYVAATAVCSTTIRTMVTLTQAEYDALANKDANTFYIII